MFVDSIKSVCPVSHPQITRRKSIQKGTTFFSQKYQKWFTWVKITESTIAISDKSKKKKMKNKQIAKEKKGKNKTKQDETSDNKEEIQYGVEEEKPGYYAKAIQDCEVDAKWRTGILSSIMKSEKIGCMIFFDGDVANPINLNPIYQSYVDAEPCLSVFYYRNYTTYKQHQSFKDQFSSKVVWTTEQRWQR